MLVGMSSYTYKRYATRKTYKQEVSCYCALEILRIKVTFFSFALFSGQVYNQKFNLNTDFFLN
jgi:hypothetical protein